MELLSSLIISVLGGMSIAIILVEKRNTWPVRIYRVYLRAFLRRIHKRAPKMLQCSVCSAFWATLLVEIVLAIAYHPITYWLWPISGFIASAMTWALMDFLISFAAISLNDNK